MLGQSEDRAGGQVQAAMERQHCQGHSEPRFQNHRRLTARLSGRAFPVHMVLGQHSGWHTPRRCPPLSHTAALLSFLL